MTARPSRADTATLLRVGAYGAAMALVAALIDIVFFHDSVPGLAIAVILVGIGQRGVAWAILRHRGQHPHRWWWL